MDGSVPRTGDRDPIRIAIVAMGGQGGGVLGEWIAGAAQQCGFVVQATSVPGVAQRTGATIYYLEMIRAEPGRPQPVLALMPVPGDVDLVIAAELMEAGRAMLRGLVTPDRTTLIASSQRAYAVAEKEAPGDGTADGAIVLEAAGIAARRSIIADFAGIAEANGSVVSASLLGALAASGALPLSRAALEQAIRDGGIGVEASLRAFAQGHAAVERGLEPAVVRPAKRLPELPGPLGHAELDGLVSRIREEFPEPARRMIYAGVRHLTDFQDPAYAGAYLDYLKGILAVDRTAGGEARGFALTTETARQLARAMAYDDVIRVADLKTRAARAPRIAAEARADPGRHVVETTEYFHPRMHEVCGTLPAWLGEAIERRPWLMRGLDRFVDRGRHVRTDTIRGYLTLYWVAGMKRRRRGTLRHKREAAHVAGWLAAVRGAAPANYDLAVELAKTRRLIKGYSDTFSRGQSKYERVLSGAMRVAGRSDAADWVRRLRQAALLDEEGAALDGALRTIETLDEPVADYAASKDVV